MRFRSDLGQSVGCEALPRRRAVADLVLATRDGWAEPPLAKVGAFWGGSQSGGEPLLATLWAVIGCDGLEHSLASDPDRVGVGVGWLTREPEPEKTDDEHKPAEAQSDQPRILVVGS